MSFGTGLLIGLLGGRIGCCNRGYMPLMTPPLSCWGTPSITDTSDFASRYFSTQAQFMNSEARMGFWYDNMALQQASTYPPMLPVPTKNYWENFYKQYYDNLGVSLGNTRTPENPSESPAKVADTDGDGEVSLAEETAYQKFKTNFASVYNVLGAYYSANAKTKYATELRTVLEKFKNTTTPTKDDYANLKSVYLKVSRDASEGKKLSMVFEMFKLDELERSGHKFSRTKNANDTILKNKLDALELEITSLNGETDYNSDELENLINFNKDDESGLGDDILRVISYWNDTRTGDDKRSIIRLINTKIPEKKEQCEYAVKKLVQPLVQSLMNRANELASDLDGEITTQLNDQKTAVFNALKTVTDKHCKGTASKKDSASLNALANEFEKLYKLCRLAEAQRINEEIKTEYGFINDLATDDKDLVTNTILNDTIADLEAEGLKDVEVNIDLNPVVGEVDGNNDEDLGVTPPGATPPGATPPESTPGANPPGATPGTQRIEGLDDACLVPLSDMYEGQEIFRLADCMGKNDLYVIKDGKLMKVVNLEYKDGEFKVKEGETVKYQEVNVAGLQAEYEAALNKVEEEEAAEAAEALNLTPEQVTAARTLGVELYGLLDYDTDSYKWNDIETIIDQKVNSNNILEVLDSFTEKSKGGKWRKRIGSQTRRVGWDIQQRFFTYILSEWGSNNKNVSCAQKMLGYFVDHVEARKDQITGDNRKHLDNYLTKIKEYQTKETLKKADGKELDNLVHNIINILRSINAES